MGKKGSKTCHDIVCHKEVGTGGSKSNMQDVIKFALF